MFYINGNKNLIKFLLKERYYILFRKKIFVFKGILVFFI